MDGIVAEKTQLDQRWTTDLARIEQEVLQKYHAAFNERQAKWNSWQEGAENTLACLRTDIQKQDT